MPEPAWVNTPAGRLRLIRHEQPQQFICDRCLRPKVARVVVDWVPNGRPARRICNGCHGALRSGETP